MRRYEEELQNANFHERQGNTQLAITHLNRAEKCTHDEEELKHLRMWRNRLQKQEQANG